MNHFSNEDALEAVDRTAAQRALADAAGAASGAHAHVEARDDRVLLTVREADAAAEDVRLRLRRSLFHGRHSYALHCRTAWRGRRQRDRAPRLQKVALGAPPARVGDVSVGAHVAVGEVPQCEELREGDGMRRAREHDLSLLLVARNLTCALEVFLMYFFQIGPWNFM